MERHGPGEGASDPAEVPDPAPRPAGQRGGPSVTV